MPVFKGTTSGSITSSALNQPSVIKSYTLTNKTGGALTVQVAIVEPTVSTTYIRTESVAANSTIYGSDEIVLKTGFYILVIAGGEFDYYFSIQ